MPAETALQAPKPQGPIGAFWSSFTQNRGAVSGLVILALVIGVAIFADFIAPHSAVEQFRNFTKLPPAWVEGGNKEFLLGTDALGRDMLALNIWRAHFTFHRPLRNDRFSHRGDRARPDCRLSRRRC